MTVKTSKKSASKTENNLTPKQEKFCQTYVNGDTELFGNGTQCYLEVYGLKDDKSGRRITYLTARVNASRLLTNANIVKRINELLETGGFTDENVDKQHLFLINQHADFKAKLGAIREFNQLKARIKKPGDNPNNPLYIQVSKEIAEKNNVSPSSAKPNS